MARVLGVEIPNEKKLFISLRHIYGIGPVLAEKAIESTGILRDKRVKDLTESELGKLAAYIRQNFKIEGDLRREISANIQRLIEINSFRGGRHRHSLPVRGQRTRTNARTRKGPKKTVGVIRDKAARKSLRQEQKSNK